MFKGMELVEHLDKLRKQNRTSISNTVEEISKPIEQAKTEELSTPDDNSLKYMKGEYIVKSITLNNLSIENISIRYNQVKEDCSGDFTIERISIGNSSINFDFVPEKDITDEKENQKTRPLASQRTRGARSPFQTRLNPSTFPNGIPRPTFLNGAERRLIMLIAEYAQVSRLKAEKIILNASRRDVQRLLMFFRDIPEDALLKRIASIRQCTEEEAQSYIRDNKSEAEVAFMKDNILAFYNKYKDSIADDAKEIPDSDAEDLINSIKRANEEEVKDKEEQENDESEK